jgi:hypothetical protein
MAALPEVEESGTLLDVKEEVVTGAVTPLPETAGDKSRPSVPVPATGGGSGGGSGAKKKKKGKR